jgi:hypothetical protein
MIREKYRAPEQSAETDLTRSTLPGMKREKFRAPEQSAETDAH